MANLFSLKIITPEQTFFSGQASSISVPGTAGSLGIMANHAALVTSLIPGKLSFKNEQGEQKFYQSPGEGFMEVHKNAVKVILSKAPTALEGSHPSAAAH